MDSGLLSSRLKLAYTVENLNALSSGIISAYKNENLAFLRQIHALIYRGDQGAEVRPSRLFSKVIMHYHPDRHSQIVKEIDRGAEASDLETLKKYEHILQVLEMDFSEKAVYGSRGGVDVDFDYSDVWDFASEGYSYIDDEEREQEDDDLMDDLVMNHGFIAAAKRKIYGHINVNFPVHLLADMEFIEMAEYEIENLDGIEYCVYARIIDLSGNNLTEVTLLGQCGFLEEVYLQNNHISYLDGLNELPYLRVVDLSFNDVDDVSPLFEVDTLEFINLLGNKVPNWQLEHLSKMGVAVVY